MTEETERVIGERRMALLRNTAAATAATLTESELFGAVQQALSGSRDLPSTLTYLLDAETGEAKLACRTGISGFHPLAPATIDPTSPAAPWPLRDVLGGSGGGVVLVPTDGLALALTPWSRPVTHALVLPMVQQSQRRIPGIVITGLSPFRPIDDAYQSFVRLLVGQLSAGVVNAHAYQEERRRAEMLAELDRAKTIFFSNVSHEFRTPLTLLLGPLDHARRLQDQLPPSVREQLELARRNSQRLLKLVNTLLDFSRIEAGRMRARFEPIDICLFTADLASTFRSAMEAAGLTYRVTCTGPEEPVSLDREMWEKIVLNLISNAFKFTLTGEIAVVMSERDRQALLTVRDTGVGIPPQELPRIFERFHRVEGAHGRSHEGSGIGLSLVQELVKLHGGDISVASEEGKGSEFAVSIPLGRPALARPRRWPPSPSVSIRPGRRCMSKKRCAGCLHRLSTGRMGCRRR